MPALKVKKEIQVQAKTVRIHAKCYGDYIILDIDLDTGKILNWKAPSAEDIEEWIESVTKD